MTDRRRLPVRPAGTSTDTTGASEGHHSRPEAPGGSGHGHGVAAGADTRYLLVALGLIAGFMVGELVAAVVGGSLVLFADAGHMLTDVAALGASVWAARLAARPAGPVWTYGLKRAEILSAAVNGVSLAAIGLVITVEAIRRLVAPPPVTGALVLGVALVGVVVNVAATWVLAKANRSSLNVRGAFAHILTDLYAFAGTAAAGLVIVLTGWARLKTCLARCHARMRDRRFHRSRFYPARQEARRRVMEAVWPVTALYFGPAATWVYRRYGRPQTTRWLAEHDRDEPPDKPSWATIAVGVATAARAARWGGEGGRAQRDQL